MLKAEIDATYGVKKRALFDVFSGTASALIQKSKLIDDETKERAVRMALDEFWLYLSDARDGPANYARNLICWCLDPETQNEYLVACGCRDRKALGDTEYLRLAQIDQRDGIKRKMTV